MNLLQAATSWSTRVVHLDRLVKRMFFLAIHLARLACRIHSSNQQPLKKRSNQRILVRISSSASEAKTFDLKKRIDCSGYLYSKTFEYCMRVNLD
jgi:hypothetical protein